MKTEGVRDLVHEILDVRPSRTREVIDDVFLAIETTPVWRTRYEGLCDDLTTDTVNQWIGRWVRRTLGWPRVTRLRSRPAACAERLACLRPTTIEAHRSAALRMSKAASQLGCRRQTPA